MPSLHQLDASTLRAVVTTFSETVHQHAAVLNLLNVYPVPDGDTGTNMARTLEAVVAEMNAAAEDLGATCEAISHGSLMGARGNSGVILSQILRGLAVTLRDDREDTGTRMASALAAAAAGAYQAVLKPVEGTILTVVREAAGAATLAAEAGGALADVLDAAHRAGAEALERTPDLLPVLRDAGVVDAGGAGFLLFLDAALHVVTGRPLPTPDLSSVPDPSGVIPTTSPPPGPRVGGADELDVSEQRYEVMYLCELADDRIGELKARWGEIADSIVVVGGDGMWNCHVHTNDIGGAIEAALDLGGRPSRIRITDLFEEVAEEHAHREADLLRRPQDTGDAGVGRSVAVPTGRCGVVAVSAGDGLTTLFRELGATVVHGGQTANPSTAELLEAVERCASEEIVILPNNKNIVPVARQVDRLTTKPVVVVPTCSMPEGLAALVVHDPEASADEVAAEMNEAIASVVTGEITSAVRDSQSAVGPVREGSWIGLVRAEGIVAVHDDLSGAVTALLDSIVGDDHEILTVLTGEGASDAVTEMIHEWVADHRADVEVEVHHGGQRLYPYLFGVE